MVSYPRAELAIVRIGNLEIEGLMLDDGTFGIAIPQVCTLFQIPIKHASRDIKALLHGDFQFPKWCSKLHPKAVNVLLLKDFESVLFELALKQNQVAIEFSRTIIGLSLQQLFSDAFCIQFEKEERQDWLKDRQSGKVVRRTLTDAIRDYIKAHNVSERYAAFVYPNITDLINRAIFNRRSAKQLREDWGVDNPRDYMTQNELLLIMEVEHLATRLIDKDDLEPGLAVKEAISRLCLPVIKR
jgi:hypothetical protein